MKAKSLTIVGLLACVAASVSGAPSKLNSKITGDYVEARSASVYAGACHIQGELMTTGRDAVLAWSFTNGSYKDVNLKGVRVLAAISAEDTLADDQAARKSELTFDPSATDAQVNAVQALLTEKVGSKLGQIVKVSRAPISFTHDSAGYAVKADGFATLKVQGMPDDACCVTPSSVWFTPLSPIDGRKVGYTESAVFTGSVSDRWERFGENSAFYGAFAF